MNKHIVKVKFLGATNTRSSRIALKVWYNGKDVTFATLSYDHRYRSAVDQAVTYLQSIGAEPLHTGIYSNDVYIITCDSLCDEICNKVFK